MRELRRKNQSPGDAGGNYHKAISISTVSRRAWIGLGSNLGQRQVNLSRALRWLAVTPYVHVDAVSSFWVTAPIGPPQPAYLNAVARLRTQLPPLALLQALQCLEDAGGRRRGVHWGPRTLDLDLLLVEGVVMTHPRLTLPHRGLAVRRFVLGPLAELDPGLVHPVLDRTVASLLEACLE